MITGFIITIFYNAIYGFISLFPTDAGFSSSFVTGLANFFTVVHSYDYFLPASTFFTFAALSLSIEVTWFGVQGVMWLLKIVADFL